MAAGSSSGNETPDDKSYAERTFPKLSNVLELMVSVQRLNAQLMWHMGEAMADMMAMPLGRERADGDKNGPINRCMTNLKDAVDGATEVLQQGGKPR
jgi:hypothetical protein